MMTDNSLVMKFGGTSVGSVDAIERIVEITTKAKKEWENLVIVASALSGVTSRLLESAEEASKGNHDLYIHYADILKDRHYSIAEKFIQNSNRKATLTREIEQLIFNFVNLCQAIEILREATPRALDSVASLGEKMSVRLLASILVEKGIMARYVDSTQLIITDSHYQSAHPNFEKTSLCSREVLIPLLSEGIVPVVTGFLAATADGVPTTLGRGGSDYSAAILGAVLPADEVWIWTDVDGVMTADPRIVPEAETIPMLTFREVGELAYFGAKVLHPKTIRPVIEAGIELRVLNTFNPQLPGTQIISNGSEDRGDSKQFIKAVTAIREQKLVTVEGRGMLGVPGVAARTFRAVAETGTSVILISQASSEQSICFSIPSVSVDLVISALEEAFASELLQRDIDRIWATSETVIVTVVGAGMQYTPGVAGQIFSALGRRGINVIAIAQGSSEASISMVLEARDTEEAVKALHTLIVKEGAMSHD